MGWTVVGLQNDLREEMSERNIHFWETILMRRERERKCSARVGGLVYTNSPGSKACVFFEKKKKVIQRRGKVPPENRQRWG